MGKTPYSNPDPPKTPYDEPPGQPQRPNQHGFDRWLARGRACPSCGSRNTVRDHFYNQEQSCSNCLMDGCTIGCDLIFWPFLLIYFFNPKRRAQTCLDCGHHWQSW